MKHLFEVIEDQAIFNFSGRVNILAKNGQHLGHVLLRDGNLVDAWMTRAKGYKALCAIHIGEMSEDFNYVVEPEIIDQVSIFNEDLEEIKAIVHDYTKKFMKIKHLRPADGISITICPEFVKSNEDVTSEEFDLLTTISDYNNVNEIYEKSDLLDHEITINLISLRQKKAIRVIK